MKTLMWMPLIALVVAQSAATAGDENRKSEESRKRSDQQEKRAEQVAPLRRPRD